jgi:hypothetical protein
MTNEDKKIVVDYMNWPASGNDMRHEMFDLNDAGLVVDEMQKRGDWMSFITFADNEHFDKEISVEFSAWFYDADNFFSAFVEWRKGK